MIIQSDTELRYTRVIYEMITRVDYSRIVYLQNGQSGTAQKSIMQTSNVIYEVYYSEFVRQASYSTTDVVNEQLKSRQYRPVDLCAYVKIVYTVA